MNIVFVDDDAQVLEGLRRMLFGRRDVWAMRFFSDPRAALSAIEQTPADLVVSDLQMPAMDGTVFLEHVRKLLPEAIRYVLTGVLDHPLLGRAIRCSHQVIAKPCNPRELCEAISRAGAIRERLKALKQTRIVQGLDSLPVMPDTHQKALDLLCSPKASPRRLGQIIAEDVGLSAHLVQIANSPYFGRPGRVHDPIGATLLLGVKTVEAILLSEGLFKRIDPKLIDIFGIAGLQSHCLRVSMLARKMCMDLQFSIEQTDAAATAGILHDAGKIVLISSAPESFVRVLAESRTGGQPLYRVEQDCLGISHAELAGAMLQLWAMPASIIEAVACHHCPDEAITTLDERVIPTLADVVGIADAIDHSWSSSMADGATPDVGVQRLKKLRLLDYYPQWQEHHHQMQQKEAICDYCVA